MTPPAPDSEESTAVALARMETKLDLVIGQHSTQLSDHETRLRVVEDRRTVSPTGLLSAAVGIITVLGGGLALLQNVL